MRKYADRSKTALDADVFWVPKYFWCFKFYKLTVLKRRQSENWKQRWVNHAHKHTEPQVSNKIKKFWHLLEELFSVDTITQTVRSSLIIQFLSSETAPLCPLLLKHETISARAGSSCSTDSHFSKEKSCEMGPFGMSLWPLCSPHAWHVYSTVNYSRAGGAQLRDPRHGLVLGPDQFTPCVALMLTCCSSSFPATKPSSWGSAGAPVWMELVLKSHNKYYNLFAEGSTRNAPCASQRQLEGEWFWLCIENLYRPCLLCQRIFFLRSSGLKFLSTQIYDTLYLL